MADPAAPVPFHTVAAEQSEIVCRLHLGLLQGAVDRLGQSGGRSACSPSLHPVCVRRSCRSPPCTAFRPQPPPPHDPMHRTRPEWCASPPPGHASAFQPAVRHLRAAAGHRAARGPAARQPQRPSGTLRCGAVRGQPGRRRSSMQGPAGASVRRIGSCGQVVSGPLAASLCDVGVRSGRRRRQLLPSVNGACPRVGRSPPAHAPT